MKILREAIVENVAIRIIQGDITESDTDAIVNAANTHLIHGGGVAGDIVRKGGTVIQEESNRIGFVHVGECAVTGGGRLKASFVIHTVGPRMGEGHEDEKLKKAIQNTLKTATARGLKSLAMPAISAGIFGFPKDRCARITVKEIKNYLQSNKTTLQEIRLYLMDPEVIDYFIKELSPLDASRTI